MSSIVVVDYGSQYTRLITRRLRELNVFSVIVPHTADLATIRGHEPMSVILSGGPQSVTDPGAPGLPAGLLDADLPILAICYGMQLVARDLGGEVHASPVREYGKAALSRYQGTLFEGVEGEFVAWMSHGDSVAQPPAGFRVCASTDDTPVAAMEWPERRIFALQFHPEVRHTRRAWPCSSASSMPPASRARGPPRTS